MSNLLKNPRFEGDWTRDNHLGIEFAEIFTPEGWITWWSQQKEVPHDPENLVGYAKPETKVIPNKPPFVDPPRVRSGQKAYLLFTFWRIHDGGLYQRVTGMEPQSRLKASAWGHAWSSQDDDAHTSIDDDNISLRVGIDPAGGTDPFSDDIVWSKPQHIYDKFGQVSVEATSAGEAVTVFLRSTVLWPYKHCDVYWDDAVLEIVPEGTELGELGSGQPRVQYERVYILLPPGASSEWIQAIVDSGRWDEEHWTIGASADDAGIGNLDKRIVVAVNPDSWPDDLEAFFKQHYPGVIYKPLPATSPQALRDLLKGINI